LVAVEQLGLGDLHVLAVNSDGVAGFRRLFFLLLAFAVFVFLALIGRHFRPGFRVLVRSVRFRVRFLTTRALGWRGLFPLQKPGDHRHRIPFAPGVRVGAVGFHVISLSG